MTHEETIQALQAQVADLQRRMGIFAYLSIGFEYMDWGVADYESGGGSQIGNLFKHLAPLNSLKDIPGLPILYAENGVEFYALFYDETDHALLIGDDHGETLWLFVCEFGGFEDFISTGLYT